MDWLLYFMFVFEVYCFLGWCLEEAYSYFVSGHFKKDGFLKGPFKPMYGFAIAILAYFYYIAELRGGLLGVMFIIIPTLIEYISGYGLKKYLGKVYWDYSKLKYNLQGLICAKFSVFWTILVLVTVSLIQPIINLIYYNYSGILSRMVPMIAIYMFVDVFFTVKQISYSKIKVS